MSYWLKNSIIVSVLTITLAIIVSAYHPLVSAKNLTATSFVVNYDSRYISEGRNNLTRGGLISGAVEFSFNDLKTSLWHGEATHNHYQETNYFVSMTHDINDISIETGYTYLSSVDELNLSRTHDHELSFGITGSLLNDVQYQISYSYAHLAKGSFISGKVWRVYPLLTDLELSPYLSLGHNHGYVVNEHKGLNDFQLGIEAKKNIQANLYLFGYLAHTQGLNKKTGESLVNTTWLGVNLTYSL